MNIERPICGEIWFSNLLTTQDQGRLTTGRHFVLAVSRDECSQFSNHSTVLPFTSAHRSDGELKPRPDGLLITPEELKSCGGNLRHASLILCDHLIPLPVAPPDRADLDMQKGPQSFAGSEVMRRVRDRLNLILAENNLSPRAFDNSLKPGDIIVRRQDALGHSVQRLVLSSLSFNRRSQFVVCVPLWNELGYRDTLAPIVEVEGSGNQMVVICPLLAAIDLVKFPCNRIGRTTTVDRALRVVRNYLGLNMSKESDSRTPQSGAERDPVRSPKEKRALIDHLGKLLREEHLETLRSVLETEGPDEDLFEPIHTRADQRVPTPLFRDGIRRAAEWMVDGIADFRRSVQLPAASFALAAVGKPVMGSPTKTYECDLMYLLEELGVAEEFETFKLFCETGRGTTISASLIPRERADADESPVEVSLYLSQVEPAATRRKKSTGNPPNRLELHLSPYTDETSSRKMPFNEMGDPTKFAGKLDIRISEVARGHDGSTDG